MNLKNKGGKIQEIMKKNHFRKIDKLLEIPKEVYSNEVKITIVGFEEIIIENYQGILDYEEYFVRIKTHTGIINLNGYNFNLENLSNDDIKVTGKIEGIEFERLVEEENAN